LLKICIINVGFLSLDTYKKTPFNTNKSQVILENGVKINNFMKTKVITLAEFIILKQSEYSFASGELSGLLRDIGFASKIIHREVNKAGLVDILGNTSEKNVHGEVVKKLDILANEQFMDALRSSGQCAGVASEELEDIVAFEGERAENAKYVVAMDPLDGSSNIDVNVSVGTIFSIYRRVSTSGKCTLEDFLQKGTEQVAAGYIIYGSSTMMMYTTGNGVNGFTLDPSIGEFCLSHPNITTPPDGEIYSINHGYRWNFSDGVKKYIDHCINSDRSRSKPYSMRYIGSMVADIHRNLIKGGIFMYPTSDDSPNGKLRILYESNPMSFIVEQAGGKATTGRFRILDYKPKSLHQRTPVFMGSKNMVQKLQDCLEVDYEGADLTQMP